MENLNLITMKIFKNNIITSIIVILLSFAVYRIISGFLLKGRNNSKMKKMSNKSKTYLRMITSIIRYIFIIVTILIILQINGVDVSSMLAGVGILSVIIGLAVQDALKDIIKGMNILSDSYFQVGDVIKYNEIEGKVLTIGLKTTRIQDLSTSNIISIANRNIEEVQIVSHNIYINIPMPYEVSLEKAEKAIDDILNSISKIDKVENCRYIGVNDLADSCIKYLIEVSCIPDFKLQTRRDSLRTILDELAKNNIEVPYNQIDVHTK